MTELLNLFCSCHPEFIESISVLSENIKQDALDRLENAKTETDFLSLIAEINFGLLFNKLGFQLEYEKKYSKKTPDWTITLQNSTAICEVYRMGLSKKDQNISDFVNQIKRNFSKLPYSYRIRFTFLQEYFESTKYDAEKIIFELSEWLKKSGRLIGDKTIIENNFIFEIDSVTNKNHLITGGKIDFKPEKLIQFEHLESDNNITEKISKYNSIIIQNQLPYFICIDSDFRNAFNYNEFVECFLGSSVIDTTPCPEACYLPEYDEWGIEFTDLGVFYKNPLLSGVIIKICNEFKILLNPMKNQLIYNEKNRFILEKLKAIVIANAS